jgi:hypothetical protein
MLKFLKIHILINCLIGLVLSLFAQKQGIASFFSGSLLVLLNAYILWFAWSFLLKKKLVALSLIAIVFKYAILGIIIYKLLKQTWLNPLYLGFGVGTLALTALVFSLTQGEHLNSDSV